MSGLDKISELQHQLDLLRAEVEKEEKESKSINKRWKAECGDGYWAVVDYGMPDWSYNYNRDMDSFRYDTHNHFETKTEAQKYANVLKTERQLKRFADEHNDAIDWTNIEQEKYYLSYSYSDYKVIIANRHWTKDSRTIYFSSEKIAKQAINKIGEDKIKEYLTYEW